jgi:protein CMS1
MHLASSLSSHADQFNQANDIKDTTSWQKLRTLENLPAFLEDFTEDPKQLSTASKKKKGAPHTIVVTGAGLRAAELVR